VRGLARGVAAPLRKRGMQVPATAETQNALSQGSLHALDALVASVRMVFDVRSGLRRQRRLTALAIADEAPAVVFYALRAGRALTAERRSAIRPKKE